MGNKYKFIQEYEDDRGLKTLVTVETNEVILRDLVERFEEFLKGCGYNLKGSLIIDEECDSCD